MHECHGGVANESSAVGVVGGLVRHADALRRVGLEPIVSSEVLRPPFAVAADVILVVVWRSGPAAGGDVGVGRLAALRWQVTRLVAPSK